MQTNACRLTHGQTDTDITHQQTAHFIHRLDSWCSIWLNMQFMEHICILLYTCTWVYTSICYLRQWSFSTPFWFCYTCMTLLGCNQLHSGSATYTWHHWGAISSILVLQQMHDTTTGALSIPFWFCYIYVSKCSTSIQIPHIQTVLTKHVAVAALGHMMWQFINCFLQSYMLYFSLIKFI